MAVVFMAMVVVVLMAMVAIVLMAMVTVVLMAMVAVVLMAMVAVVLMAMVVFMVVMLMIRVSMLMVIILYSSEDDVFSYDDGIFLACKDYGKCLKMHSLSVLFLFFFKWRSAHAH